MRIGYLVVGLVIGAAVFLAASDAKFTVDIERQKQDYLDYRFDTLETKIEQMELQVKLTADESGDCSLVTVKE